MAAPITNDSFSQQVTEAFNMLKYASPQQMQAAAQFVQRNPQSPEAIALAMASQWQQQMRSAPPAPTSTILDQKLAQIPAEQGIVSAGANQYALQADPYNAGIGAASGGLVALARGGEVRGFAEGDTAGLEPSSIVKMLQHDPSRVEAVKQWFAESAEPMGAGWGNRAAGLSAPTEADYAVAQPVESAPQEEAPPQQMPPKADKPKADRPKASKKEAAVPKQVEQAIVQEAVQNNVQAHATNSQPVQSLDDLVRKYEEMYGKNIDYASIQQQVSEAQKDLLEAKKEMLPTAVTQGLVGLLSAYGQPYAVGGTQYRRGLNEALASGILSGMQGYEEGKQGVASRTKDIRDLLASQQKLRGDTTGAAITAAIQSQQAQETERAHTAQEQLERDLLEKVRIPDMLSETAYRQGMLDVAKSRGAGVAGGMSLKEKQFVLNDLKAQAARVENRLKDMSLNPEARAQYTRQLDQLVAQMAALSSGGEAPALAPAENPVASLGSLAHGQGRPGSDAKFVPLQQ
jgi:hypothetical protein